MTAWLLVAGDFAPHGGMDAANHALARWLAARGEVHLVAHRVWPDLAAMPGVQVHLARRPFGRHALGAPLLAREGQRIWRRLLPGGNRALVNGGNCAVAAANWVHYLHAAYTPASSGTAMRRAIASRVRQRDLDDEREALRLARIVICNSRRTRDDVVARAGVDPARTRIIYYGSDPVRFAPPSPEEREFARRGLQVRPDRPLAGFIGALGDRRKAFDTVFRAWTELCASPDWDVDLVVAGTGAELPGWRRRAAEAGLADRIRFLGFRQDVPRILGALDVLVHPARYEAYGLSVHEAICRGVPALVSASAGVAEQYPAALGDLLIGDPDSSDELVGRLVRWRENQEALRQSVAPLSSKLRARTWDTMAEDIASCMASAA